MPKDLDETKRSLQTPLLLDGIMFGGTHLGHVSSMKFEDRDLVDHEKFPHLKTRNLMKQNTTGVVITLELRKWLREVEKVGLLNLLWVPQFPPRPNNHFSHEVATLPSA